MVSIAARRLSTVDAEPRRVLRDRALAGELGTALEADAWDGEAVETVSGTGGATGMVCGAFNTLLPTSKLRPCWNW